MERFVEIKEKLNKMLDMFNPVGYNDGSAFDATVLKDNVQFMIAGAHKDKEGHIYIDSFHGEDTFSFEFTENSDQKAEEIEKFINQASQIFNSANLKK